MTEIPVPTVQVTVTRKTVEEGSVKLTKDEVLLLLRRGGLLIPEDGDIKLYGPREGDFSWKEDTLNIEWRTETAEPLEPGEGDSPAYARYKKDFPLNEPRD